MKTMMPEKENISVAFWEWHVSDRRFSQTWQVGHRKRVETSPECTHLRHEISIRRCLRLAWYSQRCYLYYPD